MNTHRLLDALRLSPWLLGALLTTILVGWMAPHQLGVLLWSLSKLSLGAYLGYWIDRSVFFYARPGDLHRLASVAIENARPAVTRMAYQNYRAAMLRRALIMAAAILALGLGV